MVMTQQRFFFGSKSKEQKEEKETASKKEDEKEEKETAESK